MIFASFEKNGDDESRGHRGNLRQRPQRTADREEQEQTREPRKQRPGRASERETKEPTRKPRKHRSPHRLPPASWRASRDSGGDDWGAQKFHVYGVRKPRRHDEDERRPIKRNRDPVRAMSRSELFQYYRAIGLLREFYRLYPNPKG
jgi:hypothetical protein